MACSIRLSRVVYCNPTWLVQAGTTAGETPVDDASPDASVVEGLGSNVEVVGNRIQLSNTHRHRPPSPSPSFTQFGRGYRHDGILHIKHDDLHSYVVLAAVSGGDLGGVRGLNEIPDCAASQHPLFLCVLLNCMYSIS